MRLLQAKITILFLKSFNGKNIITFSQFNNKKKQGQNIINLVFGEKR